MVSESGKREMLAALDGMLDYYKDEPEALSVIRSLRRKVETHSGGSLLERPDLTPEETSILQRILA